MAQELQPGDWITGPCWERSVQVILLQPRAGYELLIPSARAEKLARVVERAAAGGAVPVVDVLHTVCLLWQENRQEDLAARIAARGEELWPIAQAVVELPGHDSAERKALPSLLGTRARRWAWV